MPFVLFVIRPARCLGDDASYLRLYQSHLDWCVPSAFAYSAARIRLSEILLAGDIPVTCAEDGRIRPVTPEELQAGYRVDIGENALTDPHGELPPLPGNRVCQDTLLAVLRELAEPEPSEPDSHAPERMRGRRPTQAPRVIDAMRVDLREGYDLAGATEEEMAAKYDASRGVCRMA
jgi:hypothetical protein